MARIPEEQIERLKQEVTLFRLVESQGYQTIDILSRHPL
jgi:hypothetical protein